MIKTNPKIEVQISALNQAAKPYTAAIQSRRLEFERQWESAHKDKTNSRGERDRWVLEQMRHDKVALENMKHVDAIVEQIRVLSEQLHRG